MPPIPPRRTLRDLLVPRDATETARQGQGIGDLEAMRQMATTAIPEVLRNAPATSTAMSVFDMAKAVAERDMPGAGMAALGMIPFAGALRYADEAARAAKALPMDEASRMARAAEQGYTMPVYHGTSKTAPIDALLPASATGSTPHAFDLDAVHVGTKLQANERLADAFMLGRRKNVQFQSAKKANVPRGWGEKRMSNAIDAGILTEERAPSVMPLLMKSEKPFINAAEGRPFTEKELMSSIKQFATDNRINDMTQAQRMYKQRLIDEGYDSVPYVNNIEGEGQVSHMVLKPENLRSRFAKFDPANIGKAGLMSALVGTLGLSAIGSSKPDGQR